MHITHIATWDDGELVCYAGPHEFVPGNGCCYLHSMIDGQRTVHCLPFGQLLWEDGAEIFRGHFVKLEPGDGIMFFEFDREIRFIPSGGRDWRDSILAHHGRLSDWQLTGSGLIVRTDGQLSLATPGQYGVWNQRQPLFQGDIVGWSVTAGGRVVINRNWWCRHPSRSGLLWWNMRAEPLIAIEADVSCPVGDDGLYVANQQLHEIAWLPMIHLEWSSGITVYQGPMDDAWGSTDGLYVLVDGEVRFFRRPFGITTAPTDADVEAW